jgi:hypothetical protein
VFWENEEAFKASLSNKTVFEEDIARLIKKNPKLYDNLSLAQKARYNSL